MKALLVLALAFVSGLAQAEGLFGKNGTDDVFNVKSVQGRQAVVTGKIKDLKSGDVLYFARSPFRFTVTEVKGNDVTIALPDSHDLHEGSSVIRFPTDAIKKNIATESKLKQALED